MRIIIWQTRDYKHAIHEEKLICMHLSFGKNLNKCNIWLVISGQSNCIDHKMACKACLAWESQGAFLIWLLIVMPVIFFPKLQYMLEYVSKINNNRRVNVMLLFSVCVLGGINTLLHSSLTYPSQFSMPLPWLHP